MGYNSKFKLDIWPADRFRRYKVITKLFEIDEEAKCFVDYGGDSLEATSGEISPDTLKELSKLFPSLTITLEAHGEEFDAITKTYYYRGLSQEVYYTFPEPSETKWN